MKTVLTGGKFNKIHPGHVWLLKKARAMGDRLVVVIANDAHNKRPYAVPAKQRKKNMEKLKIADQAVVGDPQDYFKVVKRFKPSVIVLGYDQELPPGVKEKLGKKIQVVKCKKYRNYSSKKLASKK
ncbi:MAG: adenylyltransferase/cytidyltransferase family protein [Candidatus Aenigmarchaeota archaeon]|nr:adenylyltransferase/cytidyltransferase family protein [Candidatus Aenigmarchaeota archaeon]